MNFKLSLLVPKKKIPSALNFNEDINGLPNFPKTDFASMTFFGQGSCGRANKALKDDKCFVIKELCYADANDTEKRLFREEAILLNSASGNENIVKICGFLQLIIVFCCNM